MNRSLKNLIGPLPEKYYGNVHDWKDIKHLVMIEKDNGR